MTGARFIGVVRAWTLRVPTRDRVAEPYRNCVRSVLAREAVADLPDRHDVPRLRGMLLELAPQLGDVRIDGATHHERAVSPHFRQQILARRHRTLSAQQREQEIVRLGSESAGNAVAKAGARPEIDDDIAELHFRLFLLLTIGGR